MITINCFLCFLILWTLNLTSSAPMNNMSPFLKSMIGTKAIRLGDIPSYSTKPAHVTQTSPVTKRDADNSDARHYMIQTTDEIMNITLYPNRKLLSRNFIVQQRTDTGDLETMNVSAKNCYYTGSVADHQFSRVSVSMCDGEMKGLIEIDDDMYVMEPADERNKDHSHVAHKMKHKLMNFEDNNAMMMDVHMNGFNGSVEESGAQKKRQSSLTNTIELMVYVDAGVQNDASQNGFLVIEYILGIINTMARLYLDSTLQYQIDLTLTRLILEGVNGAASINIQQDVDSTLDTFCSYQQSINTPDDSNPLHFDHAILITNVDLCGNDGNGGCSNGVIGYAPVGGMCSQSYSCTINENNGFSTAFTLAHETGHNLGMEHDGTNSLCVNSQRIMAPSSGGKAESFLWSSCSVSYLRTFLSSGRAACLEDVPAEAEIDINTTALVGLNFSADEQCRALHGPTAAFCSDDDDAFKEICSRLWCQPGGWRTCTTRNTPPVDGTSCGSTNICVRGQCIDGSTIVTPVNGSWSEFGPYSSCSRTCGGGVRYRERQCNNPTPEFGGSFCSGSAREYDPRLCNTNECPQGFPSFINQQCAATNNRPFNGVLYKWQEFTENAIGVTPCQLVCTTVSAQRNIIAIREPVAVDGTPCDNPNSSYAVCVQGTCTPVGCDDVLESGAQPDICGVCNGDDSGAQSVTNTLTGSGWYGYYIAGVIPVGARNVRIAEATATSSVYLALQSQGQAILNNGYLVRGTSSFTAIGSTFQYVRSSSEESVFTTGPLQQQLTVQALLVGSRSYRLTVEYSLCNSS